jgi:hypothetical protein
MSNVQVSVYPSAHSVMDLSRSIVNDAFRNGAGRVLTDNAPFTLPYLNSAQRTLQDYLANNGVSNFVKDNYQMSNLPIIQNPEAGTYVNITWQGTLATDGSFNDPNIVLPPDMLVPLDLRERLANSGQRFVRMGQPQDGLGSRSQIGALGEWEWINDTVRLYGATQLRDLQLRYEARLPLIGTPLTGSMNGCNSNLDLNDAKIMMRDSEDAMAWRVAYLYATARGAAQAGSLDGEYRQAAARIVVRNARRDQRIQFTRRPFATEETGVPLGIYRG